MSFFSKFWTYITKQPEHHLDQLDHPACSTYSIATALGKSKQWAEELYPYSDRVPQKALRKLIERGEIKSFTQGKGITFAVEALEKGNPLILVCPWPTKITPNYFLDVKDVKGGHAIVVGEYQKSIFTLIGSSGNDWAEHGDVLLKDVDLEYLTYDLGGNLLEIHA